jgi:hypothetical protein
VYLISALIEWKDFLGNSPLYVTSLHESLFFFAHSIQGGCIVQSHLCSCELFFQSMQPGQQGSDISWFLPRNSLCYKVEASKLSIKDQIIIISGFVYLTGLCHNYSNSHCSTKVATDNTWTNGYSYVLVKQTVGHSFLIAFLRWVFSLLVF